MEVLKISSLCVKNSSLKSDTRLSGLTLISFPEEGKKRDLDRQKDTDGFLGYLWWWWCRV